MTKLAITGVAGLVLATLFGCGGNSGSASSGSGTSAGPSGPAPGASGPTTRPSTPGTPSTQPAPTTQASPTTQSAPSTPGVLKSEVIFTRTGGFVGTNDKATIQPDGAYKTSGRLLGDRTGNLTPGQLASLAAALRTWPVAPGQPPGAAADAFQFSVTYAGQTVTWSEATANLPESLRSLPGLILNAVTATTTGSQTR